MLPALSVIIVKHIGQEGGEDMQENVWGKRKTPIHD